MASNCDIEKALLDVAIDTLKQVEASEKAHCSRANSLAEELEKARQRITELEADAERLDWMIERWNEDGSYLQDYVIEDCFELLEPEFIDADEVAAMKAGVRRLISNDIAAQRQKEGE
jgi:hypothetical protein